MAILLNRMRLFGVMELAGSRPILAWSAGAMRSTSLRCEAETRRTSTIAPFLDSVGTEIAGPPPPRTLESSSGRQSTG